MSLLDFFYSPVFYDNFCCTLKYSTFYNFMNILFVYCRAFCVGSKDMNTRVYGTQKFRNLIVYSMSGHTDVIVGAFFELNSLDVSFASKLQV